MRRREEEEEEEEEEEGRIKAKKVWNLGFCMETEFMNGFYEIMYEFPCFDGYPLAQI